MASLGHLAVGVAAARIDNTERPAQRASLRSMLLWSALSFLPDADVIGFSLGIRYQDEWGHRGATHSLAFALAIGIAVGLLAPRFRRPAFRTGVLATLVVVSHGLLDTLTDGGLGIALLWPFSQMRYFAPWTPIPVSPIGLGYLSPYGFFVGVAESILFAPLFWFGLRTTSEAKMKTSRILVRVALLAAWLIATSRILFAQSQPAVPLEPIGAILDAFRTHQIVALSEGRHNNRPSHAFRLALVRDPRFAALVNDIVVEFGGSQHQEVIDRFVRGESVPDAVLRRVWWDTTEPQPVWDVPIYEEFFRAVRAVNASRPRDRQLRVLLGDPPFDWDHATRDEWLAVDRDRFAADLIQREVLSKGRRALVIYGNGHFMRRLPSETRVPSTLVTRLEASGQTRVFTIWTHTNELGDLQTLQSDIDRWHPPTLALTKNTSLGAAAYRFYLTNEPEDGLRMEDQFDAVLYLGPRSTITLAILPWSLCADAEYLTMRLRRMALADPPNASRPAGVLSPAERLKQVCAAVPKTSARP